jgi:hypothetical protein
MMTNEESVQILRSLNTSELINTAKVVIDFTKSMGHDLAMTGLVEVLTERLQGALIVINEAADIVEILLGKEANNEKA